MRRQVNFVLDFLLAYFENTPTVIDESLNRAEPLFGASTAVELLERQFRTFNLPVRLQDHLR